MESRNVPFNYCLRWLQASIKISERYYSLFLGCGLLYFFTIGAVSFIPYFGNVASLFLTFLYSLGGMRFAKQIKETGAGTFDDYVRYTFDPIIFDQFKPYLFIILALALFQITTTFLEINILMGFSSLVGWLLLTFFAFGAFMILQNPTVTWQDAFVLVLKGFWRNILTLIVGAFLYTAFALVSVILCFVPLLLYFLPMTIPLAYLIYASIFEDLDIEQTIAAWRHTASPAMSPVPTPPESV